MKRLTLDKVEKAILIAPIWTTQPWFPMILEQLIQIPRLLPIRKNLLKNAGDQNHPLIKNGQLRLGAFLVTGIPSKAEDFRKHLPISWQTPEKTAQQQFTNRPGENGVLGVIEDIWIPLIQM